eukprot:5632665-Pyramimonas_sp.AAC.1
MSIMVSIEGYKVVQRGSVHALEGYRGQRGSAHALEGYGGGLRTLWRVTEGVCFTFAGGGGGGADEVQAGAGADAEVGAHGGHGAALCGVELGDGRAHQHQRPHAEGPAL